MFRPMRRKQKDIGAEAAAELLKNERRGVIAVKGDDGYPYAVPVNYIYCEEDGKIYFHGSSAGHKADSVRKDDKVCFTVYGGETVKDEAWAPYLSSTVIFGRCRFVEDEERKTELLRKLAGKYYPSGELIEEEIGRSGKAAQIYELTIEHMTGKYIQER